MTCHWYQLVSPLLWYWVTNVSLWCSSLLQFSAQSVMDAAKDVAGRVVSAAQSVAKAVSYLPQGLRDGASKAVQQATSLLETVRNVREGGRREEEF